MTYKKNKIITLLFLFSIVIFVASSLQADTFDFSSSNSTNNTGLPRYNEKSIGARIPTWTINDSWVYEASIYSNNDNGIFNINSDALTFSIENTTSMTHQNESIDVYTINISGEIYGTFENSTISGDITGEINGKAIVRQADLSLLHLNVTSSGILEWLFFDFDFEMNSVSTYYPSFEYYDFPIVKNETWNSTSTVHQNSSIFVETIIDNETESTEQIEGIVTCDKIENISVSAGMFSTYHVISQQPNSTIESWFNSTVKNMVRFHLNQSNETSTTIIHLNLSSSILQSQQLQILADITPSVSNIGKTVNLSGSVSSEDEPIVYTDVNIKIPYTNEEYTTLTDEYGDFHLTLTTPLLLDPTHTTYDIGSDGILITAADDENNNATKVVTLTVTGLALTDIKATPQIQSQFNPVNIACKAFSMEPIDEIKVNISGPDGFTTQNVSMIHHADEIYCFSQNYSITGEYHFFIWLKDENGNFTVSPINTFLIISEDQVLDINQSIFNRGFPIRYAIDGDWAGAQNFTPTVNTLTKAEIYLRKFGSPAFNLTVELRTQNPQGPIIDSLVFTPDDVSSSWNWLELDFSDVTVVPGTDYFIVCPPAPSGVTTSFGYEWGYAFGNQYDNGSFWFTRDGGGLWRDLPMMYEFVFRTYGYS